MEFYHRITSSSSSKDILTWVLKATSRLCFLQARMLITLFNYISIHLSCLNINKPSNTNVKSLYKRKLLKRNHLVEQCTLEATEAGDPGEMLHWFKALAPLIEDLGSSTSTHMMAENFSQRIQCLLWPLQEQYTCTWHTDIQASKIPRYVKKKNICKKKKKRGKQSSLLHSLPENQGESWKLCLICNVAQRLGAWVTFAEDPDSIPRTHTMVHNHL